MSQKKRSETHVTINQHHAPSLIEEAVVHLHGLTHYCSDQLTTKECQFLETAKKNLAIMHRRLSDGT